MTTQRVRRRDFRSVLLVVIVAAGLGSSATLRGDEVRLIPGTTVKQAIGGVVRGQVQSESATEVVVLVGANPVPVPVDQIVSIRYDSQSATFPLAEARESAGQLGEAADLFKKAAAEAAGRPYPQQSALFREARVLGDLALVEPDRVKVARDKLTQFVRTYPNSRQLVAARESLAKLQIHAGDFSGAEATITALARMPKAAERAAVLRIKVLAHQGKHGDAIAELDQLIASSPKGSERLHAAMLAKAESLVGMKKFKEAEALVREVILASPAEDAEAQAPAYNTLGDCLRAADHPKEALIAYLHTDLLYSKDKTEHPRALHAIATLFRQIKQDAKADEFALRLKQEYPRSSWNRADADAQ
jgi:tetratricopeptide (TPR) repeat protein